MAEVAELAELVDVVEVPEPVELVELVEVAEVVELVTLLPLQPVLPPAHRRTDEATKQRSNRPTQAWWRSTVKEASKQASKCVLRGVKNKCSIILFSGTCASDFPGGQEQSRGKAGGAQRQTPCKKWLKKLKKFFKKIN